VTIELLFRLGAKLRDQSQTFRLSMLKWTSKLAAVILGLCVWGTPLMACLVSDTLTEAERECCLQMADNCGSSAMPDSHSCCETTVQQLDPYLANSRFDTGLSHPAIIQVVGLDFSAPLTLMVTQAAPTNSPPLSPPEAISILRI
jgi:hypothetical protein